jgi:hypothetical protein
MRGLAHPLLSSSVTLLPFFPTLFFPPTALHQLLFVYLNFLG